MRLVGAELLKIATAYRTALGILLAEVAIVLLGTITTVRSAANDPALPRHFERDLVGIAGTALLFATLLGVLIATTEYRHGTITLTFLATPVRERVLAAKTAAAIIGSALLVLPALILSVSIGVIWLGSRPEFHFGAEEYELIGRLFLAAAMVAMLGLFIGATLTRQLGAIILVLGWLFFAEPALSALVPETEDYLAGPSLGGVLGGDSSAPSFGHALPVLTAYVLGLAALATFFTRRRDIT
jgi:ABC-type transport system involved in multi-copper enzyme maturation permease subunit